MSDSPKSLIGDEGEHRSEKKKDVVVSSERVKHRERGGMFVDDEAEVSDEEEGETRALSEDEEGDELGDSEMKEMSNFIAVDGEGDDQDKSEIGDEDDQEDEYEIDDDDYQLIADNLGLKFNRKSDNVVDSKKRKLRRAVDDLEEMDEENEFEDDLSSDGDESLDRFISQPKKKKTRHGNDVYDIGGQYEDDRRSSQNVGIPTPDDAFKIFGDMTDFLNQGDVYFESDEDDEGGDGSIELMAKMDPELQRRLYLTDEDKTVRQMDVPERFQNRIERRKDLESFVFEEADWISMNAFSAKKSSLRSDAVASAQFMKSIEAVLKLIREEMMEVPFISIYRKEYWKPWLTVQDLWKIDEWDEKWDHFLASKQKLKKVIRRIPGESISLVDASSNETDTDDIRSYLQYRTLQMMDSMGISESNSDSRKLPINRSFYQWKYAESLEGFVKEIMPSARDIGESLLYRGAQYKPAIPQYPPESLATGYISDKFTYPEQVIKTSVQVAAWRLSLDPYFKSRARRDIFLEACLSTRMTVEGESSIDYTSDYFEVRELALKPIKAILDEDYPEYVLIMKGVKEKYLEMEISCPSLDSIAREYAEKSRVDENSQLCQKWNDLRDEVISIALKDYVFPSVIKNIETSLNDRSNEIVSRAVYSSVFDLASVLPCSKRESIAAISVGAPGHPSLLVMLDRLGKPLETMQLNFLKNVSKSGRETKELIQQKSDDRRLWNGFIERHQPTLIVIDASSTEANDLKRVLEDSLAGKTCKIEFLDPQLARIYMNSDRAIEEFPNISPEVRFTISLGRYRIDPLALVCEICSDYEQINYQSLNLHPLQHYVDQSVVQQSVHRALMDVVSNVGVDLYRASFHKNFSHTLQFVSGLGPRKARHLLQFITQRGHIFRTRNELLSQGVVGPVVFKNLAGFIRILKMDEFAKVSISPLEETRVHPDSYLFVDRILNSIVDSTTVNVDSRDSFIFKIRKGDYINELEDLDLDAYASHLEQRGEGKFAYTLQLIHDELLQPYRDFIRKPFRSYDSKTLFGLMTGETNLRQGQKIYVQIVGKSPSTVFASFGSGIRCLIFLRDIDSSDPILEQLSVQNSIEGRILDINYERFELKLGITPDILKGDDERFVERDSRKNRNSRWLPAYTGSSQRSRNDDKNGVFPSSVPSVALIQRPPLIKRNINHKYFFNISREEAEEQLRHSTEDFPTIIRPSSKGMDHLTITWRVWEDLFSHIDVQEFEKPFPDSLGKVLVIGDQKFEDLDEVVHEYVQPIIRLVQQMSDFKHFRFGNLKTLYEYLEVEKQNYPEKVPYYIGYDIENPGMFVICFLLSSTPRHDFIKVTPEGYKYNGKICRTPEEVVKRFKMRAMEASQRKAVHSFPSSRDRGAYGMSAGPPHDSRYPHRGIHLQGPPIVSDSYERDRVHSSRWAEPMPYHDRPVYPPRTESYTPYDPPYGHYESQSADRYSRDYGERRDRGRPRQDRERDYRRSYN